MAQNLFNTQNKDNRAENRPLADRLRPEELDEFFGQNEAARIIKSFIYEDKIPSMIFWGPPGTGKTTIAHIIAKKTKSFFLPLSAVTTNIPEVKKRIAEAADRLNIYGQKTIIFVDEIHRFNKLQQDAFLPHVEDGAIILIGATTENPSFEVNSALLSRCKTLVLRRLSDNDLMEIIKRALEDKEKGLGNLDLELSKDGMDYLINYADGDARRALNLLEEAANSPLSQRKSLSSPLSQRGVSYHTKNFGVVAGGDFSTAGTGNKENEGTRDGAEIRAEVAGSEESLRAEKSPRLPCGQPTPFNKGGNPPPACAGRPIPRPANAGRPPFGKGGKPSASNHRRDSLGNQPKKFAFV